MKILILMDSFKGSLSSKEAGEIVKDSILNLNPEEDIKVLPIADGGEGTVDVFLDLPGSKKILVNVKDPLFNERIAKYALLKDQNLAVMEMSEASGLTLIKDNLSPLRATTFGVGEMIIDALNLGVRNFLIGIGGSATNDGGVGMLSALGFRFLDQDDEEIYPANMGLSAISKIDTKKVDKRIYESSFKIACDVDNPLTGPNGSARVYGPQKGASEEEVLIIDLNLAHLHKKTLEIFPDADDKYPGVGAAGGIGYAFKNYLNADLKPGINLVLAALNAEDLIKNSDLIITGEGKIDFQTAMGKTPVGVAALSKKYDKKVIAFAGVIDNDAVIVNNMGIDAFFPIIDKITSVDEALNKKKAAENLSRTVGQVFRLIYLYKDKNNF